MNIRVIETGTVQGYEDYHADIVCNGNKIGESHYDKKQRKYIAMIGTKRIYRNTLEAVHKAVIQLLIGGECELYF